ncbi:tetratricopeptide repeat protein, partial [Micromonospora arborensis]|uniref:tetratricopeptide repeat protein n=1 Tax=Micromonospora arborensis TaxID=2116518 RepID=UPI00340F6FAD
MSADPRVPQYLGRILGPGGAAAGTCFQVAPTGVLVTAWHVLEDLGAGDEGCVVQIDALDGGLSPLDARVVKVDPLHDLAVLIRPEPLAATVGSMVMADSIDALTSVVVAGVSLVDDPDHDYRWMAATGAWKIGTTRDNQVPLGRFSSSDVLPGMSGGPVRRLDDDAVVGVVSGRYNSADGWLAGSVWVARVEDLLPLLTDVEHAPTKGALWTTTTLALTLDIGESQTRLSGSGVQAAADHDGMSIALADAVNRLRFARTQLVGMRTTGSLSSPATESTATSKVGRLLASRYLPDQIAEALTSTLAVARARHVPVTLGLRVRGELAQLPWETLWLNEAAVPLALDNLVRLYRQVEATPVIGMAGPLRILVAISSPLSGGGGVLDYEQELRNVLRAVRGARTSEAEVRIVHFATTDAINTALMEQPVHVLHLSGHAGPGMFELEDEAGHAKSVTAEQFIQEAIPPGRMPPVVALAGCHTNTATATGDPSFASHLLSRGAGVVIATQTSITDVYSTRVFARVYGHLAATPECDAVAAVAQARVAVQRELEQSPDDRDKRIAALNEWAVLSVQSGPASMPVLDSEAPRLPSTPRPSSGGVLRRETGEVVGRRWEQRRYPAELLGASMAGMVLHGIGGVGKTTLADELLSRLQESTPSLVVAIVQKAITADELVGTIIDALAERLYQPPRPPWASEAVLRALARAGDGSLSWQKRFLALRNTVLPAVPILIMLDNFEDNLGTAAGILPTLVDESLAALLAGLAAAPGQSRMLITSRYRFTLPAHAEHALSFKPVRPLSYAETMKLAWALPHLDRLDDDELEQLWRAVGGHPRCLEYLDALLAGGRARFTDVRLRLVDIVTERLRQLERPITQVQQYLTEHTRLNDALAEAAALAADDVLLDDLYRRLAQVPGAHRLLLGASVYRLPVGQHALAYQLGAPDPSASNISQWQAAQRHIQQILAAARIAPGRVDLADLPQSVLKSLAPHLGVRLTPPVRMDMDLAEALAACAESSLLMLSEAGGEIITFMHRWTATELQRRQIAAGQTTEIVDAHRRAATYWLWRVAAWPQPPDHDVNDLREAHHHYEEAVRHGDDDALADLASVAHRLEIRLGDLGRRAEALTYSEQAVALKRRLAQVDQPAHGQDLAGFISNLGSRLSDLGRREEGLTATTEAVDLYRLLAGTSPTAFEPDLAMSLNNLGNRLSDLGRYEEGLTATTEAVDLYRRLAATSPTAFEPDLAMSLNNLGNRLSNLARHEEALTATTEATDLYRRLVSTSPAAFEPNLAMSLNNLGNRLSDLGRHEEALAATTEAIAIRRRLATASPAAFEPNLASSLNNLGNQLSDLGRHEEALTATTEGTDLYRRLAATSPAAFEPNLAMSLNNLGNRLSNLGRYEEGLTATTEAIAIRRRLATASPAAFEPNLAMSLNNLGNQLSNLGRHEEALTATTEATDLYRRLAATSPTAFEPNLAMSLNNLGNRLSDLGRYEEAFTATTEAVDLYRRLAATSPTAFEPDLAMSLNNLGNRLSNLARHEEALTAITESTDLYRRLAATSPTAFEPNLASSLNNLGNQLSNLSRHEEALTATTEAIAIRRRLAATNPTAFEPNLASSLNNLGNRLSNLARHEEALTATTEAIAIRRRLAATNPTAFEPNLA